MNIIYTHTNPNFAIGRDQYQWILSLKKTNRGEWGENSYFPKMSLLFEELAEQMFRKNVKKIKELKDLDNCIQKTYDLISDLSVDLEGAFLENDQLKAFPIASVVKIMKKYFVKLQQEEIELCKTHAEIAVFASIKSYTSNGKKEVALSYGDIAKRAKCSRPYVKRIVTQLTPQLIEIVGKRKVFGGLANVYRLSTWLTPSVNTVNTFSKKVVSVVNEGVPPVNEGVNNSRTNLHNLKPKTKENSTSLIVHKEKLPWKILDALERSGQ
jgi:hypothetical protein